MITGCVRCGGPVGPDGVCPECAGSLSFVERELQRLRQDMIRKRDGGSDTWGGDEAVVGPRTDSVDPEEGRDETEAAGESAGPPTAVHRGRSPRGHHGDPGSDSAENAGNEADPGRASGWGGDVSLRARELDVTTPEGAREALEEVLEHRRKGRGKIIGIAGLPRHGKTKLADRLRERAVERPGVDLRYDKTSRGRVNVYYVPGREEHHVLIDMAGEDFQLLGDYSRELPALMSEFLWPVLQDLDGMLLLAALPIVWSGWNQPGVDRRQDPDEALRDEMRKASATMVASHRTLLKFAIVAKGLRKLGRTGRRFGIGPERAPTRSQIDDVYRSAPDLPCPVLVGFSKADLFAPGDSRSGLFSPSPPGMDGIVTPPLHPLRTDPLVLGRTHFPELFDFLLARVRHFKFDFVQALEDASDRPDPQEARIPDAPIETLVGAEGALAFLTGHPWSFPGISTRTALRLDRWLRRSRWNGGAVQALAGTEPAEVL